MIWNLCGSPNLRVNIHDVNLDTDRAVKLRSHVGRSATSFVPPVSGPFRAILSVDKGMSEDARQETSVSNRHRVYHHAFFFLMSFNMARLVVIAAFE